MLRWLVLVAICGCSPPDGDYFGRLAPEPGVFRWCNQGEPDHLDPTLSSSTSSSQLVAAVFDGLTTYGPDGLPVPSLATHWDISADLTRFTFHLRADAQWSNGRPITAYDVAHSVFRVAHPLTASPNADTLAPIKGATAFLTRHVVVVQRAVAGLAAGQVVERVDATDVEPNRRAATAPLALRDLGAAPGDAYAIVPPGQPVTIMMVSGGAATLPSPAGAPWAYVLWPRDLAGVGGWVPLADLDVQPDGDRPVEVRAGGVAITVRARDVLAITDAIGVRVPDPHTIIFETTDPTPSFVALTDSRALRPTPIEAWSRWPRSWDRPDHIISSGPFQLVAWRERDRVELVRSPSYWDRAHVTLDRLIAYSMDDQAASTNAYVTGACDATAANNIPSSYLPALQAHAYKDYDVAPFLGVYFAWIQTQKLPNRHLRRALSLAIDRSQIPQFTHGGELATAQLTPGTPIAQLSPADLAACGVARDAPGHALVMVTGALCYVPPPGLDYDPAAARREVELARAEGGLPDHPIEYRFNAGAEAHKQIAEYLQAAWAAVGIPVRLMAQDWNALLDDTHKGDYEISRLGSIGNFADPETEFLSLFRCASPDNRGRYCSAEFERLMDQASALADRRARNAVLRAAEAVMIADAPVLPIYVYTQKHLIKPYVRGYAVNLIDQPPLWQVSIDPTLP